MKSLMSILLSNVVQALRLQYLIVLAKNLLKICICKLKNDLNYFNKKTSNCIFQRTSIYSHFLKHNFCPKQFTPIKKHDLMNYFNKLYLYRYIVL